jgi:hypothetical protein
MEIIYGDRAFADHEKAGLATALNGMSISSKNSALGLWPTRGLNHARRAVWHVGQDRFKLGARALGSVATVKKALATEIVVRAAVTYLSMLSG